MARQAGRAGRPHAENDPARAGGDPDHLGKFAKTSIDKQFQDQVRDMVKPGTSALFLMLEKVTPDKAVEAMSKYGGTVLKTSLSKQDEKELQDALHGDQAAAQ